MVPEQIPEPDWKVLGPVKKAALERFHTKILQEIAMISADSRPIRDRYMDVYRRLTERDDELGLVFNYNSRPKAILQLAMLREWDLITEEEFLRFSAETRSTVDGMLKVFRRAPTEVGDGGRP